MDRYEWADDEGAWRAESEEVFEIFDADEDRPLFSGSDPRAAAGRELLRLAGRVEELEKERDGYKELLSDELLRGAAEIREMARESEAADRQLVAHLGAIVGLESATVLQAGDQPPFAMAICGELLMAAWKLREENERLRKRLEEAEGLLRAVREQSGNSHHLTPNTRDGLSAFLRG